MNPTDQDLVRRSIEGEEDAFNEIINRYKRGIYTLIIRMVRDRDAAEDLSQETFIRLYSSLASYNPAYKFSSWLFKIANNLTIDHLRKNKPNIFSLDEPLEMDEDSVTIQVPSAGEDPLDRVASLELGEKIRQAIEDLPVDYRQVVLLRHLEDMSYEDIADITGLPLGTVKTLLFRGRRLLRNRLRFIREAGS